MLVFEIIGLVVKKGWKILSLMPSEMPNLLLHRRHLHSLLLPTICTRSRIRIIHMLLKKHRKFLAHHRATLQMYNTVLVGFMPMIQYGRFVRSAALEADNQNKDEPIITGGLNVRFHGIAIKVM